MRKIFWQINMTLDGFMEDSDGSLACTAEVADPEFEEYASKMLTEIDDFIIGRKTYKMFVGYWPNETGPDAYLLTACQSMLFRQRSNRRTGTTQASSARTWLRRSRN